MSLRRFLTPLVTLLLLSSPLLAAQPKPGQGEFVPVDSVPVADQLPAAPLLIAAYAFVWIAAMVYVWSIWRRMTKVEDEMRALAQKLPRR
jgi:CcmD family protein